MQFIHYCVFGLAWLRKMNFVTQPNVELYKSIANRLHAEAERAGGIAKTKEWRRTAETARKSLARARHSALGSIAEGIAPSRKRAPRRRSMRRWSGSFPATGESTYGELTFFGDTRYSARGRAVRAVLDRAAERLFRAALKMPADVYEGPAMNHSYHEMIIGHGKCFSTILIAESDRRTPIIIGAQFLATQMALAERGRAVVSITLRDLEDADRSRALDEFFRQAATHPAGAKISMARFRPPGSRAKRHTARDRIARPDSVR